MEGIISPTVIAKVVAGSVLLILRNLVEIFQRKFGNMVTILISVTGYQIASLGFSHCEIQGFYRVGKFNYFLNKMQLSTPGG